VHAVLRKAFRDAVVVEQLLPSNPIERAKRLRKTAAEPGTVWHPAQLAAFLATARGHRLFAFYHLAAYTGPALQLRAQRGCPGTNCGIWTTSPVERAGPPLGGRPLWPGGHNLSSEQISYRVFVELYGCHGEAAPCNR
jgi:hypothetical protein